MSYKLEGCGFLAQFGTLTRSSESMTEMTNTHTQREVGIRQPGASVGNAEPPPPNKHSMFIIYSGAGRQDYCTLNQEGRVYGIQLNQEDRFS